MKTYNVTFYFNENFWQVVTCQAESPIVALHRATKLFGNHDTSKRDTEDAENVTIEVT